MGTLPPVKPMSPALRRCVKFTLLRNPFVLALEFRNILQLRSYTPLCLFVTSLGHFFPPKQASAAGGSYSVPLLRGWEMPRRGHCPPAEIGSDVSQMHVWLLMRVMISSQCPGSTNVPWAGRDCVYGTIYLYTENHPPLLGSAEAVGLHAFPYLLLTTVKCGRCYH